MSEDKQNADELLFNPPFRADSPGTVALSISEVETLLRDPYHRFKQSGLTIPDQVRSAYEHARRFGKVSNTRINEDIRNWLASWKPLADIGGPLHPFEMAQLSSLVPLSGEAASSVIPSLQRYDRGDLEQLVRHLQGMVRGDQEEQNVTFDDDEGVL